MNKTGWLFWIAAWLGLNVLHAQSPAPFAVQPDIQNKVLVARLQLGGLLTAPLKETLASGMSSTFSVQVQLIQKENHALDFRRADLQMRFDVWERFYQVKFDQQKHRFENYEDFADFVSDSLLVKMREASHYNFTQQLQFAVLVGPPAGFESRKSKLSAWLNEEGRSSESSPADETETGFAINISKLIALFLGNDQPADLRQWNSHTFTISDLSQK